MERMSLKKLFEDSCTRWGEKAAVTYFRNGRVETVLTYAQLDRDANRVAHIFQELGVAKGDRVILFIQKSLIAAVSHVALQKLGAVEVPLNPGFKKAEMQYLLNDAGASLVLTEPDRQTLIAEINPRQKVLAVSARTPYQDLDFFKTAPTASPAVNIEPADPGLIIYTSGTTGKPKGAVLTQQNLVHDARNIIDIWQISAADVICHALPLFHVHGLCFALHTALLAGAHTLMLDRFDSSTVVQILSHKNADHPCTVFMAVPAMYTRMMDDIGDKKMDFGHLRLMTSGSAPLLVKEFKRIKKIFGQEPVEREGMSETGMNFSNPLKGIRKPGSIGLPLPGLRVRIVDPGTFSDVASGQTGEIWLKGPGISSGYWRKPEETRKAFVDGWFRTGDLGRVDPDGYYYLTDRIKHIIISGGENVSAKEVESVINVLEAVVESAVVGIADEKWGEKIVAAVMAKPGGGLTPEQVQAHCSRTLHKWKCPKQILFVNEIPKNTMGKVLKEEVKRLFFTRS